MNKLPQKIIGMKLSASCFAYTFVIQRRWFCFRFEGCVWSTPHSGAQTGVSGRILSYQSQELPEDKVKTRDAS